MGCAHSRPKGPERDLSFLHSIIVQGAGKTAVASLMDDPVERKRREVALTTSLKLEGFDVTAAYAVLPTDKLISAREAGRLLYRQGFRSLAKVVQDGEKLSFQLYSLEIKARGPISTKNQPINLALRDLMAVLVEVKLSR